MSGERRTFQVYEAALALAGSERQAFLERECGSDLELRRAVDSLLRSADSAASDGFLDKPVAGNIKALGAVSHRHAPGDRIDRYQLQQVIGEGGFGTVYLALQTEPVQRKVALKLIRSDHVDNSFVRRFDSERQALALLNHPGIAQIYDAGTTPDGDPFFVMEYVDGSSITEYCDQRQLTIEERLALFQQVCAAVQHAHQKGVIHRDIKPSNVLVAESDDGPTPKVIDFGIAKATDLSIDQETLATAGGILGSPAYMSPEQLDPSVGEADTRTDVYGLGMLLYQLLAGANPFSQGSPSIVDLIRSVVEKDALRPSRLVRDLGDSDAAVDRQLHTEDLARRLESDLDWIVIRSLDKDRDRRYESPAA
ncbi:MAG: serine/threonine-protein kinase, partial [Pseudomonadota bacterium]